MIVTCEGDSNDILKELEYLTDPVVIVSYCMLLGNENSQAVIPLYTNYEGMK